MLFQQLNRTDAEKVFIICRNTSGGTLAVNVPVFFETDAVTDGNAVSQMVTSGGHLFAGINDASLTDDSYGLVQVYGARTSAVYIATVSATSGIIGQQMQGVAGQDYLTYFSAISATTTIAQNYCILMESIASAAGKSATANARVFLRAL